MKILQPVSTTQTLKIIPRSYPETVDISLRNEETNETYLLEDLSAVYNGGYLDIESTFGESIVSGVKCIDANNEYLSSPAGDYFGNTISGLDIEFDYSDLDLTQFLITAFSQGNQSDGYYIKCNFVTAINAIQIIINSNDALPVQGFQYSFPSSIPLSGNIKIKGNGSNLEIYYNDTLVLNELVNIDNDISNVNSYELYFGASELVSLLIYSGIVFSYIKINDHEWASDAWTAPTTTNSQGVVTTLHSDVSTSAMIQGTVTPYLINNNNYSFSVLDSSDDSVIYKGKIFVTDQVINEYSIQDGEYIETPSTNEYIYGQ